MKDTAFKNKVMPFLLEKRIIKRNGRLIAVEDQSNELCEALDRFAGIDYIYQFGNHVASFAVRCQKINPFNGRYDGFDTFTIRSKKDTLTTTEKFKRSEAIKWGYIYPTFTVQAYLKDNMDGDVISVAIIKTVDLYSVYEKHPKIIKTNYAHTGGDTNIFDNILWSDLKSKGYRISMYPSRSEEAEVKYVEIEDPNFDDPFSD